MYWRIIILSISLSQALAKQFAHVLDFVLAFDDLKVCWSYPEIARRYRCIVYYVVVVLQYAPDYMGNNVPLQNREVKA